MILFPFVFLLLIQLPTILLWQHPHFPLHGTDAQFQQYQKDDFRNDELQGWVLEASILVEALVAIVGLSLLSKRPEEEDTTKKITIQIDAKWQRIVQSPVMGVVGALTGVACTFCPLFLYCCGKGTMFKGQEYFLVPLCFVVIYGVSFFYIALGGAVIAELRKKSNAPSRYLDR
jgi:cytochrome c biogenesis protein CcdA